MSFSFSETDKGFIQLKTFRDKGDDASFDAVVNALTVVYGGDGVTVDTIQEAFKKTMEASAAQMAIDEAKKKVEGYTPSNAFIMVVKDAEEVAKGFGGKAVVMASLNGDGEVVITANFKGIDGIKGVRSTGRKNTRYDYFDNGEKVKGHLKRHILKTYPDSKTASIIEEYDEKEGSTISAWDAAERGMKDGDSFVITRSVRESSGS